MATKKVLTKIRENLPAQEARWITAALCCDPLVWGSLQDIPLSADGSEFTAGAYKKWSPAALALRALESTTTPEDLAGDLACTPEVGLLQSSLKTFQEARRSLRAPKTLADAGLLAIALRQQWSQESAWKGFLNLLASNGEPTPNHIPVWRTAIACLYGMVPDPIEMLRGLLSRRPSLISYSLVSDAILSNPASENEMAQSFFNLVAGVPPLHQVGWLRFLKLKGKEDLVVDLAQGLLKKIPASSISALAELNPDELDLETLIAKSVELQRVAGLYRYANQTVNGKTMLEKARQVLVHWRGGLDLELAEIANLNDGPDAAEQVLIEAQPSLDSAPRLQQEAILQLSGVHAGDLLVRFPQAASHPIGQIYQASELAKDHKLNLAINLARQGAQQWLEDSEPAGEIPLLNFAFDWQPRSAIQILLDLGLIPEALQTIETLLKSRPGDHDLMELASIVWEQQGNLDRALEHCETLATYDPENPEQHRHLASLLARKEDWAEALREQSQVLALSNPPEVDDLIRHAIAASHLEKWDEVDASARKALQIQPDQGMAFALAGQVKLARGENEEAEHLLQQATLLAPEEALGWLLLAEWHERQNDPQKSLETLRAAVLAVPESADINFKLARICLRQGLQSDALQFLRKAAALAPGSPEVTLELGRTLYELGRLDEAYNFLSQSFHRWPNNPEIAYSFARAALASGDSAGAISGMREALKKENPPAEWQVLYARTLMEREPGLDEESETDRTYVLEAERAVDAALAQIPEDLDARILKAEILLEKGSLQQAQKQFSKLLETPEAESSEIRWRLQAGIGCTDLRMGRVASALASLQEASQVHPEKVRLQHILAEAFMAGELVKEALETAKNALNLAPDNLANLSWFAGMMLSLHEPAEAVHALHTATELCPTQPSFWIRIAEINSSLEDEKEARNAMEKLLAIQPLSENVLRQAAKILLKLGDRPRAISCLKRAVIESGSPSKKTLVELAGILWNAAENNAGLETIRMAIELDPDDGTLYILQADFLTKMERYEAAIACLEHGLNLSGSDAGKDQQFWKELATSDFLDHEWIASACNLPQVHVRFAELFRKTGSLSAAYQHVEAAYELEAASPSLALMAIDHAAALNMPAQAAKLAEEFDFTTAFSQANSALDRKALASLLAVHANLKMISNEMDEAQECIEKGFEIDPENARIEAAYAVLLTHHGDWKKAEEAYQKAMGLADRAWAGIQPGWHFPDYWLGRSAIDSEHLQEAIRFFEKAVDEFPNEPLAHFGLGMALTQAAEKKRLHAEVQCIHWLNGDDLLTDDRYEEFEKALQNAGRLGNSPEIETWKIRGRAAFRPTTQNLRGLTGLLPDPQIAAVLVAALRRAESLVAAIQTGSQFNEYPEVQAQVALAHYHSESKVCLNLARLVVEKRPADVLGWIVLALAARKFGEPEDALMALEHALASWPDEPIWHSWAAELAGSLGNVGTCVQHWEAASELIPEHFPYLMALGAAYIRNQQPYQAISALELASKLDSKRSDLWYMLAQAYRQTAQLNVALECAEKAGEMEPESAQPLLLCGEIHLALGETESALQCTQLAWNLDRLNEVSLLAYVKVLIAMNKAPEALALLDQSSLADSEAVKVERARLVASQRSPAAALPLLQALATANPHNLEVLRMLASIQAECGDNQAAVKTAGDALALQPNNAELNFLMGKLMHLDGQLDHAVHFLSAALESDPMMIEAYLELARTYQERRETTEALQIYQAATQVAPQDFRPFLNAALMLRDGKDYVGAEALLRKSAELAPGDVNIRRQLGAVITLNLIHNSQEASTAHESYWTQDIRR